MAQREFNRTVPTHGDSDDRTISPSRCRWKLIFNLFNEIAHDVVLVAILWRLSRIHVIRLIALRHNEDQTSLGESRHVGVIGPVAKTTVSTVQKVDNGELCSLSDRRRQNDPVVHIAVKRSTVKRDISHRDVWSKLWAIRLFFTSLFVARGQQRQHCAKTHDYEAQPTADHRRLNHIQQSASDDAKIQMPGSSQF